MMTESSKANSWLGLVFITVLLTVYGQLIVKWRVRQAGAFPAELADKVIYLARMMIDPWILSSLMAAILAGFCWMAAMTKLELSYAYPFMSLAFVLVFCLSALIFHEQVTIPKMLGLTLIVLGIIISSRG